MNCIRILFTFYNLIFLIVGAIILGLGIWIVADPKFAEHLQKLVEEADAEKVSDTVISVVRNAGYVLISFGGIVFFLSFVGCCGAIKQSRFLLGVYTFLLVLILILEIVAAILILVVYGPELEEKTQTFLTQKLQQKYDYPDYNAATRAGGQENGFARTLDGIMVKFQCCGITNPSDFKNVTVPPSQPPGTQVPITCCQCENVANCTGLPDFPTSDQIKAIRFKECRSNPSSTNSNTGGCYAKLRENILSGDGKAVGIGIGIIIGLLQLIGIVIGVYVYKTSKSY